MYWGLATDPPARHGDDDRRQTHLSHSGGGDTGLKASCDTQCGSFLDFASPACHAHRPRVSNNPLVLTMTIG